MPDTATDTVTDSDLDEMGRYYALITSAETIVRMARDIGPERTRDILEDHMALDDPDETDEWRLIFDGISDTLRRAADQREGCNRWITIHDASDKSSVQFAWDSTDTHPGPEYVRTVWCAIFDSLGRVQTAEAPE